MIKALLKKIAGVLGLSPHLSRAANNLQGVSLRIKRSAIKRRMGTPAPLFLKSTISPNSASVRFAARSVEGSGSVRLPYQVDYSEHPAFAEYLVWNQSYDNQIDVAIEALNALILDFEAKLTLKRTTLGVAVERIHEGILPIIDLLITANRAAGNDFIPFAKRFHLEILRVLTDDLAYFDRRNSYVPVINNSAELALRNELAVKGFLEFDLTPAELVALRHQLKEYIDKLERRYQDGGRSREALSINEIDPVSISMMSQLFERRGLNKAVSDVLHERAEACSFAVELSTEDSDWWHSRYEDVGLLRPNKSAYFHNDEGRSIYKAIIYMTDVDDDTGPFGYIPETFTVERPRFDWAVARATLTTLQSDEVRSTMTDIRASRGVFTSHVARRFFGMLPARLRLNSHFGFDVLDDSDLATRLESQEVRMIGPAGHAIVMDGSRIIHRGGLIQRGKRWALQVVFEVGRENGANLFREMSRGLEEKLHVN